MLELTEEQQRAMEAQKEGLLRLLNPRTQEVFVLVREDVYQAACGFLRPLGRGWDNPADDDLIRTQE
jgi:hypothetical protein